jgi:hypothetical protein
MSKEFDSSLENKSKENDAHRREADSADVNAARRAGIAGINELNKVETRRTNKSSGSAGGKDEESIHVVDKDGQIASRKRPLREQDLLKTSDNYESHLEKHEDKGREPNEGIDNGTLIAANTVSASFGKNLTRILIKHGDEKEPNYKPCIIYKNFVHVPNIAEEVGCPDLAKSEKLPCSAADRLLSGQALNSYNCHFYTITCALGHEPKATAGPDQKLFTKSDLNNAGFREARSFKPSEFEQNAKNLKAGDIFVVVDSATMLKEIHSAMVIDNKQPGSSVMIRQKFDPSHPVVDLNSTQFKRAFIDNKVTEI